MLIKKEKNNTASLPLFEWLTDICFFLLLDSVFANNSKVEGENYFYYFAFFAFVGVTLVKLIFRISQRGNVVVPMMTLWYAVFIIFGFASMLWADYPDATMRVMSRIVQCLIITFCMAQNYSTREGLSRCMRLISWSGTYAMAYILIKTPVSQWFSGRLGQSATQLNANAIGMIFTICTLVSFYFAFYERKPAYYVTAALQLAVLVLTGSRKSLFGVVFGIALLVLLSTGQRFYLTRIFAFVAAIALFFYLMMRVPALYAAIGRRMETLLEYFSTNEGDNSLLLRRRFIEVAKDLFFDNVLVGVGLNNFGSHLGQIWSISTYAHNNYYEILADLGIIGFAIYYSFYVYLIVGVVRALLKRSTASKLMLTVVAAIMLCEYGLVTYYAVYIQIFLCCISMFISAYSNYNNSPSELSVTQSLQNETRKDELI